MKNQTRVTNLFVATCLFLMWAPQVSFSQRLSVDSSKGTHFVSLQNGGGLLAKIPAMRGAGSGLSCRKDIEGRLSKGATGFSWRLKFSVTGKVFKDVSFATPRVGYLVTELGAVYKTTDGGETWQTRLDLGFPYYWYGVDALSEDTVVVSGFNNQGNIHSGVIRWSFNGGSTWNQNIILSIPAGVGWLDRVHFFNRDTGIVMASAAGGEHYTTQ